MLCNDLIKSKLGINITEIIEIFKEITNKENLINKEIEEYRNKRKAIEEFKEELSKYIRDIRKHNENHNENPLIFIIDELDRCRPSYAIELLECIKHLFSIEEIIFVLSIDKQQLLSSVRGFYGSDTINAEEYLRKFIDIEYSLPSVINYKADKGISFEKSLFDKYFGNFKNIPYINIAIADISNFFSNSKLTARQKEKIFISVRIAINTLNDKNRIEKFLIPFFILNFLKLQHIDFFNEIANLTLDPQVLVDKFDDLFFSLFNEPTTYLLGLIAPIIKLYICSRPNQVFPKITSKLDRIEGSTLSGFMTLYETVGLNINFFLDKINLVDR